MMNTFILFSAIAMLSGTSTAADTPQCPTELGTASIHVEPAPGWTTVIPANLKLSYAGVVVDSPALVPRAELRGEHKEINQQVSVTTYRGLASREKWLICGYGQGGEIEQAFRLQDAVNSCIIKTTKNRYEEIQMAISCER
jgi:hypothetical protein